MMLPVFSCPFWRQELVMDVRVTDLSNQRVLEILDAVKSVFASKGFDGASMQDLAQAAKMSVGNFYRYFPSKNAIINALVQLDLDCMENDFQKIVVAEDPRAAFLAKLRDRIENLSDEEAALWTEIQAASFRVPEIAELKQKMEETVRTNIVKALVMIFGGSTPEDLERYRLHAHLIFLMVHGFAQRKYCSRELQDTATNTALAELVINTLRLALQTSAAPSTPPTLSMLEGLSPQTDK